MNAKKTLSLSLASAMALGLLAGCGSSASSTAASTADSTASAADSTSTAATSDAAGKVYYLNFKLLPCSRSTALSAWPAGKTTATTCPAPRSPVS